MPTTYNRFDNQESSISIGNKGGTYTVKETSIEEDEDLNKVYNSFTGRNRSMKQCKWQWRQSPFGKSESWIIVKDHEGIVGHHGVMALDFKVFGKSVHVGKTENTFVLQQHSKQLFYPAIERKLLTLMKSRFNYIFTTASSAGRGAVKAIRQRLGYKVVGETVAYALHFNSTTLAKLVKIRYQSTLISVVCKFIYPIIHTIFTIPSRLSSRKHKIELCDWRLLKEFVDFWDANADYYGFSPNRTEKYMQWRYKDNPHQAYQLIKIVNNDNNLVGFAVTKKHNFTIAGNKFSGIMIDDIIVAKNDARKFRICFMVLEQFYHSESMVLLPTLRQNDSINKGVQLFLGLITRMHIQKGPELLMWSKNNKLPIVYLTNIFSEGVAYELDYSIRN